MYYHVVYRPKLEELPSFEEMKKFLHGKFTGYLCSCEKGNSTSDEEYNHFDIILESDVKRTDSIKRTFVNHFEVEGISVKNIRVYKMQPEKILYYIGYSRKENLAYDTTYSKEYIRDGIHAYELAEKGKKTIEVKPFRTMDDFVERFTEYLKMQIEMFGIAKPEDSIEEYYKEFVYITRTNGTLKFSLYQRIRQQSLFEYLATPRIDGEKHEILQHVNLNERIQPTSRNAIHRKEESNDA